MPAQHKRRSTMSMSMNKVPVSSYNRKSLVTSNLLSKHSQNMFRRETFYGKVDDRDMMLPLEQTGSKKLCNIKQGFNQVELSSRMQGQGTLLLGKRRSSQTSLTPNDTQSKKSATTSLKKTRFSQTHK